VFKDGYTSLIVDRVLLIKKFLFNSFLISPGDTQLVTIYVCTNVADR